MIPFCANLRQGIEREVYFLVVQVYYLTNGGENGLLGEAIAWNVRLYGEYVYVIAEIMQA